MKRANPPSQNGRVSRLPLLNRHEPQERQLREAGQKLGGEIALVAQGCGCQGSKPASEQPALDSLIRRAGALACRRCSRPIRNEAPFDRAAKRSSRTRTRPVPVRYASVWCRIWDNGLPHWPSRRGDGRDHENRDQHTRPSNPPPASSSPPSYSPVLRIRE